MADQEEDQGITAYHGSPHEFEQFDLSKIGTGEGAQAYGHGLYFAEAEPTARQYRDSLSTKLLGNIGGQGQTDWDNPEHVAASWLKIHKTPQAAIDYLESLPEQHKTPVTKKAAELLKTGSSLPETPAGHMYEVTINAHLDHFLDWDKPLSEQSEHVQNALQTIADKDEKKFGYGGGSHYYLIDPDSYSGEDLYKYLRSQNEQQNASKFLHESGIKGIKYLDAGSRGNTEKPTRNYVVFDDKLVNVKRRYAQGGEVDREGLAIGGNPGDIAGGGFGTGNIGGGSSISNGSMADARAADRASVSGYSADSGGGGGGGRDNYSSIGRSIDGGQDFGFDRADRMSPIGMGIQGGVLLGGVTPSGYGRSQSQQSMLQSMGIEGPADTSGFPTALRPGGNIGAALTKEVLTPNFSTANSPLASGIESYDQNAINALYDRMREEQQAAKDAAYQRSVIGPVTKDINVPNAGDLYGATNAPLAVNQQPSGMFGQPEFGTTKFGEAPRQSGFPQMQSQTRSLEDVMGTKPQGEYLFSGMDISQRAVPNTYSVDPNSVIQQVRKEWPNMTRAMNDQDIQNAILGGLPEGVSYKNGVLTGNINDPSLQATLQKGGVSMQTFKPVTEISATTQWGQPQAGPYRSVSMDGVAPQDFASMYPVSSRMTPAETAAEISRSIVGFPSMADKPLQVPSQATQQTTRENFNSAFAAARAQGKTTFTWTNPATGQTSTYTTQLERKNGGRVPSMSEPDEWLAEKNESKKSERRAIAKRSVMLSSSKS